MPTRQDDLADALTVLVVGLELVGERWDDLDADVRAAIVACMRARTARLTALLFPEPVRVDLTRAREPAPEPWPVAARSARAVPGAVPEPVPGAVPEAP